jgi:hypothetical protein
MALSYHHTLSLLPSRFELGSAEAGGKCVRCKWKEKVRNFGVSISRATKINAAYLFSLNSIYIPLNRGVAIEICGRLELGLRSM